HEPLWEETPDKGGRYFGPVSLGRLAARYARAARQLARRWRDVPKDPPPLVVVGFGGQLDALLARRVCRPRAGLVFAPPVSRIEPEFLTRSPVVPAARRVLFYGRYLPLHGVDTIVEAAARLGPRADVVLIGRGPERPRIEALARARGAAVTFRDEVPLATLPAE